MLFNLFVSNIKPIQFRLSVRPAPLLYFVQLTAGATTTHPATQPPTRPAAPCATMQPGRALTRRSAHAPAAGC